MQRTIGRVGLAAVLVLQAALVSALERHLGAPVLDSEAETTHRTLTWNDFKGHAKGDKVANREKWAYIATAVRQGGYELETSRDEHGEWIAKPVDFRPYAIMDKFRSSTSPGARDPAVLKFQQLHFDLAETMARRLAVELAGMRGRGEVPYDAEEDLRYQLKRKFQRRYDEMRAIHAVLDEETNGGLDRAKLKEWETKTAAMFDEATAELVALLELSE